MYRKIIEKVSGCGIDAYLIKSESNINYLFNKGNYYVPGLALITRNEIFLVTPSRNINNFRKTYSDYIVLSGDLNTVYNICKDLSIKRLGCESNLISKAEYDLMKNVFEHIELIDLPDFTEDVRMIKTSEEIELIQAATALSDKGYEEFLNHLKTGITELKARNIFNNILMDMGADGLSFETLLSSGERCFMPHSLPSEKVIADGDFVLMDFGVKLNGYCSDTSRTVIMTHADDKQAAMYDLVLKAQVNALSNIKAGMTCREADALARNIISSNLDSGCFDYGLGHGVGTQVHEKPRFHPLSSCVLKENTVMSVEPGIYIEGWGGIRIEDVFVVGKDIGGRNLTKASKNLIII